MAFLDNSGDIILDAVLTDTGRKRMAAGNFNITKFSIGDDEIDYTLYNKDHPSGSAYYDLEILQTPVLEAFTQINANINYGLLSYARQDLLYLPEIELNQKGGLTTTALLSSHASSEGIIYVADDRFVTTSNKKTSEQLALDQGSHRSIIAGGDGLGSPYILIETGINDPNGPIPSSVNQNTYLLNVGLADNNFTISYDSRFIANMEGPSIGDTFSNNGKNATPSVSFENAEVSTISTEVNNYVNATVNGLLNKVFYKVSQGTTDSSQGVSAIAGPRGSFTVLSMDVNPDIPDDHYQVYGKTGTTQGGTTTYDYIDTNIYVAGSSTNVQLQIPIRVIRVTAGSS